MRDGICNSIGLTRRVRVSARRVKFALASACPYADEWRLAAARLVTTA